MRIEMYNGNGFINMSVKRGLKLKTSKAYSNTFSNSYQFFFSENVDILCKGNKLKVFLLPHRCTANYCHTCTPVKFDVAEKKR